MASASIKANLTVVLDSSDTQFDAGVGGTPLTLTATRPFVVVDFYVIATNGGGGETVTLSKGAAVNAIVTAVACTADGDVTRASAGYSRTNATFVSDQVLTLTASAAATRAIGYATIIPSAIS
jgi:hypothetical protein